MNALSIQDIPWLVTDLLNGSLIKRWWWRNITPGYYGIPHTGGPLRIIRKGPVENNIIFNLAGDCVGDEDYTCDTWRFHPIDSDMEYSMPFIALWRTRRRKPIGIR